MRKVLCKILCVLMLAGLSISASASKEDLTEYRYIPVDAFEDALLYDLKPLAATYIEAGRMYGVDPVFLAAKDAEESGWGRYQAAPNNLGGWTGSDGYMSFDSPESYIYYSASKIAELYLDEEGRYHCGTSLSDVNEYYNGRDVWEEHIADIMDQINYRIDEHQGETDDLY